MIRRRARLASCLGAYLHGADAERAAEAEVVRQGFPTKILAQNRVKFGETGVEMLLPVMIALTLVALTLESGQKRRRSHHVLELPADRPARALVLRR